MVPIVSPFLTRPNFIKQNIGQLKKNILHMSEEQINDHLKELYKLTKTDFFEIAILSKFLKHIIKQKEYYHHKQSLSYDWSALWRSMLMLFFLLLMLLLYCPWTYIHTLYLSVIIFVVALYLMKKIYHFLHVWYNPNYQEYKEYYKKLSFIEKKLQQKIKTLT